MNQKNEVAVFGGGCFWCTEAIFQRLRGIISVKSGYAGGTVDNPSYDEVSAGTTGHAEVNRIEFDPSILSYNKLLEIFFDIHDPTTLNRQGNDTGPQYRSVIFYTNDAQLKEAQSYLDHLKESKAFVRDVVTELESHDMSGYEFIYNIRSCETSKYPFILALTEGKGSSPELKTLMECGADAFGSKDSIHHTLQPQIQALLRLKDIYEFASEGKQLSAVKALIGTYKHEFGNAIAILDGMFRKLIKNHPMIGADAASKSIQDSIKRMESVLTKLSKLREYNEEVYSEDANILKVE
jgi:peptide-methionine (S)-S-oxide reductase